MHPQELTLTDIIIIITTDVTMTTPTIIPVIRTMHIRIIMPGGLVNTAFIRRMNNIMYISAVATRTASTVTGVEV